ncbi:LacI family DNA-binding transcriptional regulator [Amycolatopsis sp. La24]|uniref:LacI family DNA-binding transcriptional regulator n=1 Tax=Amycolatopsis sp. La24 TaxID=3028304 RepID=UPI0023B1AC12|nr:LacI family DNA-binding transcriptional regulator [Amycolatopsis sp. La24]
MPTDDVPGRETAGKPRRPTMVDVAAKAGVSRALVSLVFRNQPGASEATRQRVLHAADELGYHPDNAARLLARGRSHTLGVVLTVHQPFDADMVEGIYPEAERLGYDVLLSASAPGRDEGKAVEALLSHRCEAVILLGPTSSQAYLAELGRRTVVVSVSRRVPGAHLDSVRTSAAVGVRQAIDHLVKLGHREITHVDGGKGPGASDRRRAYRSAMRRHDLTARIVPGEYSEDAGMAAAQKLLGEDRLPTAILAANDRCAVGLMHAFGRAGLELPKDLSVVGYDDNHLSHLSYIDLTTVRQDANRIAEHAVQRAVARLEDENVEPTDTVLDPKLVVRGTTGPPAAR